MSISLDNFRGSNSEEIKNLEACSPLMLAYGHPTFCFRKVQFSLHLLHRQRGDDGCFAPSAFPGDMFFAVRRGRDLLLKSREHAMAAIHAAHKCFPHAKYLLLGRLQCCLPLLVIGAPLFVPHLRFSHPATHSIDDFESALSLEPHSCRKYCCLGRERLYLRSSI